MNRIVLSLALGALAGAIDIIPMLMQKLDRHSIASAFIQWVILGFVITHIEFGIGGWLKGLIVAVLLSVPVIVLVVETDPKSSVPIVAMSVLLGSVVGFISDKFI